MSDVPMSAEPPKRRRSVGRWIGGILLLVVAVGAALALVAWLTSDTATEDRAFPADTVGAIAADVDSGDVEIVAEDRQDVAVTIVTRESLFGDPEVTVAVEGDRLVVRGDCPFNLLFNCEADFEVAVPAGWAGPIETDIAAGNTDIVGVGGTITADGAAGNITVTGFKGTEASLELSAGNVTFSSVAAPTDLRVSASAGNVRITVPDEVYRVDAEVSAGNSTVDVRTDPGSDLVISVDVSAGNIEINRR